MSVDKKARMQETTVCLVSDSFLPHETRTKPGRFRFPDSLLLRPSFVVGRTVVEEPVRVWDEIVAERIFANVPHEKIIRIESLCVIFRVK
jgi:hypothetical protein